MATQEKKRAPKGKGNKPERETEKDRKAALRQLEEAIAKVPSDPNALSSEELQAWENALAGLTNKFPFNIGKKTSEKVGQAAERGMIQTGQGKGTPYGKQNETTPVSVRQPGLIETLTPKAETPLPTRPELGEDYDPTKGPTKGTPYGEQNETTPMGPAPVFQDITHGPGPEEEAMGQQATTPVTGGGVTSEAGGDLGTRATGTPYGKQNETQRPAPVAPAIPPGGIETPVGRVPAQSSFAETLARICLSSAGTGMEAPGPKKVTSRFQRPTPKTVQAPTNLSQAPSFLSPTPTPAATQAPQVAQGARERANVLSQQAQQPRPGLPFLPPAPQPTGPQPAYRQETAPPATGSLRDRIRSVRIGGQ